MVSKNIYFLKEKGFILIELLVAILILSIMVTVGITASEKQMLKLKLDFDAKLLALNLRKWGAVVKDLEGAPAYVTFNFTNNTYYFIVNNSLKEAVALSPGIKFNSVTYSKNMANFDLRGNLNNGHITLEDRNKQFRYIIIAPTTGRIRISDIPPGSGW